MHVCTILRVAGWLAGWVDHQGCFSPSPQTPHPLSNTFQGYTYTIHIHVHIHIHTRCLQQHLKGGVCHTPGQPPRGAPRFTDSACLRRLGPTPPLRGGGRQIGLQKAFHRLVTRPGPRFWRSSLPTHSRPDPNHPITLPQPSPNPIQTIGKNGKNRFLHRGDHGQIGPRRPLQGLSHGQDRDLGNQAPLHTQYPTQITP